MPQGLGRIAYPAALVIVVGTTWCLAWARSVSDESRRGYWPARDPELMRKALRAEVAEPDPEPDSTTATIDYREPVAR